MCVHVCARAQYVPRMRVHGQRMLQCPALQLTAILSSVSDRLVWTGNAILLFLRHSVRQGELKHIMIMMMMIMMMMMMMVMMMVMPMMLMICMMMK